MHFNKIGIQNFLLLFPRLRRGYNIRSSRFVNDFSKESNVMRNDYWWLKMRERLNRSRGVSHPQDPTRLTGAQSRELENSIAKTLSRMPIHKYQSRCLMKRLIGFGWKKCHFVPHTGGYPRWVCHPFHCQMMKASLLISLDIPVRRDASERLYRRSATVRVWRKYTTQY